MLTNCAVPFWKTVTGYHKVDITTKRFDGIFHFLVIRGVNPIH